MARSTGLANLYPCIYDLSDLGKNFRLEESAGDHHESALYCKSLIQKVWKDDVDYMYIVTLKARCAGCLCTGSGWFKHIDHHRTIFTHISGQLTRCVGFCLMGSKWFDSTEPPLSTSLQGKRTCNNVNWEVRGERTTPNLCDKTLHTLLSLKPCGTLFVT